LWEIAAPFFELPQTSGTSTPIVGASEDLSVIPQGILNGNEGKRVVVPHRKVFSFSSLMSQAWEGEASSSVQRIRPPSPLYLPQAPAPAEGKEDSFNIGVFLEPFSESETEGTSLNVVSDQGGPSHQAGLPRFVANAGVETTFDTPPREPIRYFKKFRLCPRA